MNTSGSTKTVTYGSMRAERVSEQEIAVQLPLHSKRSKKHARVTLRQKQLEALAQAFMPKQPSEPAGDGWNEITPAEPKDGPGYIMVQGIRGDISIQLRSSVRWACNYAITNDCVRIDWLWRELPPARQQPETKAESES